jgi:hypothetical protein
VCRLNAGSVLCHGCLSLPMLQVVAILEAKTSRVCTAACQNSTPSMAATHHIPRGSQHPLSSAHPLHGWRGLMAENGGVARCDAWLVIVKCRSRAPLWIHPQANGRERGRGERHVLPTFHLRRSPAPALPHNHPSPVHPHSAASPHSIPPPAIPRHQARPVQATNEPAAPSPPSCNLPSSAASWFPVREW